MPLTDLQRELLQKIAANRSPNSYLAGATVLHSADNSPRYSQDLDFFHDLADSVAQSAETDASTLRDAGYDLQWSMRTPTFYRAVVTAKDSRVKLEWAQDSAFRFFPVIEDSLCGYRLHEADAAVNKMLALAGRDEARDFVDILHLHATYLSLGTLAWAACGKDPGYTPDFLLDHASRHVSYSQADFDRLDLNAAVDCTRMKKEWLTAQSTARQLVGSLPPDEVGCLYLDADNNPVTPDPGNPAFPSLIRHTGSIGGAWPATSIVGDAV
jgi:hypothetical protein